MLFSVIVPIYNAENTLIRCLDSILNQSFSDFECIMIDDGSIDSSGKICKRYELEDYRFKYIYQNNSGVSEARNRGVLESKGDFISFIDSDDEYMLDYLETFYCLIDKYPECNNFWCGFKYVSNNSSLNGKKVIFQNENRITCIDKSEIMNLHEKNLDASPVNKVYRRSVIIDNNLTMRKGLSLGEDLIFNFDYLDSNDNSMIIVINEVKYLYYCLSDESLNHRYRDNSYDIYNEIIECMFKYLKKWDVSENQFDIFYMYVFYMLESALKNTFHPKNSLSYKNKIRFNNNILHNTFFIISLRRCRKKINIFFRVAYRLKNYRLVRFCERLVKLKDKSRL